MLIYVNLNQIDDNPFQRRSEYGDIAELAGRIDVARLSYPDSYGLMQIPRGRVIFRNAAKPDGVIVSADKIVVPLPTAESTGKHALPVDPALRVQLAFGHRRLRAFRYLHETGASGYSDGLFPVHVDALNDQQMLDAVWSENRERKDISAVEEAELIAAKIELTGETQAVAAAGWGLARATVTNLLALLKLPQPVQEANRLGILSARQCSALITMARVGDLTDGGGVKWGGIDGYSWQWQAPPSPADYIKMVIENPDGVTSDAIREMTKRMIEHAGVEVPDVIATFSDYDEVPPEAGRAIVQHQCKGCVYRINQRCLLASCLETKQSYIATSLLAAAAEEFGLTISDNPKHFLANDDDARKRLKHYWHSEAAANDPDLVIGWMTGEAVRPCHSQFAWVSESRIWEDDGRRAIAIGHRNPAAIPASADPAAPDIADHATRETWKKQVEQVRKANVTAAKVNLREVIETAVADFRPLVALIQPLDAETTDDSSALVESLVEFLWKRGSSLLPYTSNATAEAANLNRLLHRAGAEPLPALSFQERAAVALTKWYEVRRHYWPEGKQEAAAAVEALRQEIVTQTLADPDMLQLSFELDRAAADAQRVLGKGEGEGETAVEEAPTTDIKTAVARFADSQDDWPELAGRTFTAPLHYLRAFGEEKPFGYFDRIRAEFLEDGDDVTDEMIRMAAIEVWSERHPSGIVVEETAVSEEAPT